MNFGINPSYFTKRYGEESPLSLESAIALCEKHGFTALLLSASMPTERAKAVRAYLDTTRAYAHQTHLPYFRYEKDVDYEAVKKRLLSCAESSYILGADIMVAHADEFDFSAQEYTPARAHEFNRRLFDGVVDFAVGHGMRVAFENVFEDMSVPRHTSRAEELLAFVEDFKTDKVGVCFDFGHAKMQYPDTYAEALDSLADKVICTHLHDNYYGKDLHSAPFLGNTNFDMLMKIYKRKCPCVPLTLELVYGTLPKTLHESYLSFLFEGVKTLTK